MSTPIAVMPVVSTESGTTTLKQSFFQFIVKEKSNRMLLYIALVGITVQFIVFKLAYPFADFFSDSYSYLFAAYANLDVSIWPIGYSKFLRMFHFITYSDTALIGFQYFFLELSALYFFYTILYFIHLPQSSKYVIFAVLFFNPLNLYISNYVNSDALFAALSIVWITQLIWIIYKPRTGLVIVHGLVLLASFTVRNNAYYYPLITILTILLSNMSTWFKLVGIAVPISLILSFVLYTRDAAYKMTGTRMYSLFTGWQLANNALYMYEYVDTTKNLSPRAKELDRISIHFFSQIPRDFLYKHFLADEGNFFIRASYSPLKQYMNHYYKVTDEYSGVVAWGKVSVVFAEYGNYLIKNNLLAYFWEFMLPNAKNYFIPYLEKLRVYNLEEDKVAPIARYWFHYRGDKVTCFSKKIQSDILYFHPLIFLMTNLFLLGSGFWFVYKRRYAVVDSNFNKIVILLSLFIAANFLFCVFATIIVMRYQFFPMIVCLILALLIAERLDTKSPLRRAADQS